jgi:prevent-host-death family protein
MQIAIENEQSLSTYVSHARSGEEVVLTQHGEVVARIVPVQEFADIPAPLLQGKEREAAFAEMMQLLEVGIPLGGGMAPSKDEMHER